MATHKISEGTLGFCSAAMKSDLFSLCNMKHDLNQWFSTLTLRQSTFSLSIWVGARNVDHLWTGLRTIGLSNLSYVHINQACVLTVGLCNIIFLCKSHYKDAFDWLCMSQKDVFPLQAPITPRLTCQVRGLIHLTGRQISIGSTCVLNTALFCQASCSQHGRICLFRTSRVLAVGQGTELTEMVMDYKTNYQEWTN